MGTQELLDLTKAEIDRLGLKRFVDTAVQNEVISDDNKKVDSQMKSLLLQFNILAFIPKQTIY